MKPAWFFLFWLMTSSAAQAAPLTLGEWLPQAEAAYAKVDDYTCQMARIERLDGKIKEHHTVLFKYRKPGHYYMKWPGDWIELIYVDGHNDNKMIIHGGKLFEFAHISVDPALALKYNRHTIREAGLGYVLDLIRHDYQKTQADHEASLSTATESSIDARPAWHFEGRFPPNKGYYGHLIKLDFDQQSHLPVRIQVYGWKNELLEAYTYTQLKLNVGLGEADFDIHNPDYDFDKGVAK